MAMLDELFKRRQSVAFSRLSLSLLRLSLSLLRLFSQLSFLFPLLLCLEKKCFVVRGAVFAHLCS
jgi:hypothetical protein